MTPSVWIKFVLKSLLLPPTGLILLALAGVVVAHRRARLGQLLITASLVILLVLSLPAIADLLVATLHTPRAFAMEDAAGAGAVVVLGGGVRRNAPDYGGDTLSSLTLERVRFGARVARLSGLPVLVSGGNPQAGTSEAVLMRNTLQDEFGQPVRWIEPDSLNTHENAVNSARILRAAGIDNIVLVMHGFDMLRARQEFAAEGIRSVPAATNLPKESALMLVDFLPSMAALQTSYFASYEIAANMVRVLSGH